jgi:hypothetical protein
MTAALLGLGISAYCVVKMFDFPDLGATAARAASYRAPAGSASVKASTTLDAGPFIGLLGGLLISLSGFALTSEEPEPHRATTVAHTPAS